MRVEYIGHSGVFVETENMNLLFDCIVGAPPSEDKDWFYDIGKMPEMDTDKMTVFFASHNHGDHYSEHIWENRERFPRHHYVLSKDVHFSSGVRARLGITDADMPHITRVKNYSSTDIQLDASLMIHVETVPSTDMGVAYLVHADGHTIYHAGDHHLWLWEEEGEKYVNDMREVFLRRCEHLASLMTTPPFAKGDEAGQIDVAFLLLDGRLEGHVEDGMDTYIDMLPIRHAIPIHQWQEYYVTDEYVEARQDFLRKNGTVLHKVTNENCMFEIH